MSNWIEVKLKDVCERITVGHVGSMADQYKATGIPFLRSLNINPYRIDFNNLKFIDEQFNQKLKKSVLQPNDVAIVRTGYPGTACVIPSSLGIANCSDLVIVKPGKQLNSYFLAAIFNSTFGKGLVAGNLVGSAQQHFNITVAKELKLRLPPKQLQDKIAAVLSTYDDLIENNDRRITLLEKMAEEIYREWFVRLRFPGHEQATFHKGIPEGWIIKELEEFCQRVTDGTHDTPKPTNEGYFLVTGKNIKNGTVDFENAYKISKKDHINISKRSGLQSGDIIFSNIGTLGSIAIVTDDIEYSVKNVLIFKPVDKNQSVFLYYMLKEQYVLENLLLHSSGASQQFIGLTVARKFKVFDPGKLLINNFGEFVLPLQQKRLLLIRANSKLKQTRDRLLTRLISGKLSVEDLDIQFPPACLRTLTRMKKHLKHQVKIYLGGLL